LNRISVTLRKDFEHLKKGNTLTVIDIMIDESRDVSFLCETECFMDWIDLDYIEEKY
jgi:hypothetical protein